MGRIIEPSGTESAPAPDPAELERQAAERRQEQLKRGRRALMVENLRVHGAFGSPSGWTSFYWR
jgi:hypothetical protein